MNTFTIKGDWNIIKGQLKQRWAQLTDDDLEYAEGKLDEVIGRIYKRTGEKNSDIEKFIHEADTRLI